MSANSTGADTTIYCPSPLRQDLWPIPLAEQWREQFPGLFDDQDIRLARSQPRNHFYKWFAAIFLFQRDGSLSMIEKYGYPSHREKLARYTHVLTKAQVAELDSIRKDFRVQLPDLLVFNRDETSFSFAEVKGDRDRLSSKQVESHAAIRGGLGVAVEIINVKLVALDSTGAGI